MKNMPDAATLLAKMISFKPVTAQKKNVNALADFIAELLRGNGLYVKVWRHGGCKCLFAATRRALKTGLLFNAHIDVVPADAAQFKPLRRGNRLFGRGAGDCLANCAVICRVLAACAGKADVAAIFSSDEETGGATTRAMLEKGCSGEFVLVMDGHGSPEIGIAQKGILAVRLTATGKSCHSATPWEGVNAIDRLIEGYLAIKKMFRPAKKGDEWRETISANIISGGSPAFNRVPDRAELTLDIRHTEKAAPAALLRAIKKASGLKTAVIMRSPVIITDPAAPAVRDFARFLRKRLKISLPFKRLNGATDARFFAALKKPIAIFCVPYSGAHSAGENVNIKWLPLIETALTQYAAERFPLKPAPKAG